MTNPSHTHSPQPGSAVSAEHSWRPSGASATIAGVLGVVLAGLTGYVPINFFLNLSSGFSLGDLPAKALVYLGIFLAAALVLLAGALTTFFRGVIGAVFLLLGSLLAIVGILFEPTVTTDGNYLQYFEIIFTFADFDTIVRAVAVILSPLVLIFAALPSTFSYLRHGAPKQEHRPS